MRSSVALLTLLGLFALLAMLACKDAPSPATPPPATALPATALPATALPTAAEVDVTATDDERRCVADGDCALATVDCCGCTALGRQTGVRKDQLDALVRRRQPICGTIACAQGMSDDPTCDATGAVCLDGTCVANVGSTGAKGVGVEKIDK